MVSKVLLEEGKGKGEESTEGKRETSHIYPNSRKEVQSWEGGGRKSRKEVGTTQCCQSYLLKGKGHSITQGRQICAFDEKQP